MQILVSPVDQRSADIRFFDGDGLQIDKRDERRLENLFFREDFRRSAFYEMGDIEYMEAVPDYTEHLLKSVNVDAIRDANLRLLVDYDYSQVSSVLPGILNEIGITTIPLNAGLREGPHTEQMPEETSLISRTVQADVACRMQPAGERLTFIDDEGTVLTPYEAFGLLVSWWVPTHPGIVLGPAMTPEWIARLVQDLGGTFVATPSDTGSVLRASAAAGTCLGSDGEGGFVWPYYFAAYDAMYTLLKMLELRALAGTTLSEARKALPTTAYITATEFCPWESKGKVMRTLLDTHREHTVDLVDGIKVFVDGGFVLVRPDPDEPMYHIVASVADETVGHRLVNEYAKLVRKARGGSASNGTARTREAVDKQTVAG
jgi:mannose-1-phosphate guanylyltransferase/phosphomannomutase